MFCLTQRQCAPAWRLPVIVLAKVGAIGILGRLLEWLWAAFAKPRLLVRLECTKTSTASEHASLLQRNSAIGIFRAVNSSELVLMFLFGFSSHPSSAPVERV